MKKVNGTKKESSNTIVQTVGKTAILVFPLPDEKYDYELATKAWNFKSSLDDMDDFLRSNLKHGLGEEVKEMLKTKQSKESFATDLLQFVRDRLNSFINENNARMECE